MTAPLLRASGIGVAIGGASILADVDFSIAQGEIVTVLGPNGSGKTTLLRVLVGAQKPTTGTVRRAAGLRLGYVPQKLHIERNMPLTVDRFLALSGVRDRGARAAALRRVGVADCAQKQMAALSGGQFQRALLAHALLRAPDLLVLDEPTQGLDQQGVARFYELVAELRAERGMAVLMVSHDLHVVMSASDRVICLNGHVCCEGAPHVVSAAPEYRALFGLGTAGALALYQHRHDHSHSHDLAPDDQAGAGAGDA